MLRFVLNQGTCNKQKEMGQSVYKLCIFNTWTKHEYKSFTISSVGNSFSGELMVNDEIIKISEAFLFHKEYIVFHTVEEYILWIGQRCAR